MRLLKAQLDENIDRCTPLGGCGAYGAPFKLTCVVYGYSVIGKGTTSGLWKDVSREAQVYQILRKAQGSAVPVFLGTVDLAKIYFLHGAGEIRHMLVIGWEAKVQRRWNSRLSFSRRYISRTERSKLWESSTKIFGVIIFCGTKSLGGRWSSTFTAPHWKVDRLCNDHER